MTNKELLRAELLDILFEHRNKAYGAYALRKNYSHRMQHALGISLGLVLLLVLMKFIDNNNSSRHHSAGKKDSVMLTEYVAKPEPEKEKPKLIEKKPVEQIKDVPIKIMPDKDVPVTEVPDQSQIDSAMISDKTVTGDKPDGTVQKATGNGDKGKDSTASPKETFIEPKQKDASFPGGMAGFADFLRKYLVSPDELEPGEKKVVLARFMVDTDGSISKIEITQSAGSSFDKEVIRALRKMPKWVPAEQNGIKVVVYYTQAVTFIGTE